MARHRNTALMTILGLTLLGSSALANTCEFDDIAIFATNSIRIGTGVMVTGNVVANDVSPGPVLDEGVELALDRPVLVEPPAAAPPGLPPRSLRNGSGCRRWAGGCAPVRLRRRRWRRFAPVPRRRAPTR